MKEEKPNYEARPQTLGEEIANAITHGVGFLIACACLSVGVALAARFEAGAKVITSVSIYGATLCILYLASTLYHAFPNGRTKRIFNIFDHSAIYLLIAGTYTPWTLGAMLPSWGWSLFGVAWGLAIVGIVFQALFINRYRAVSTLTYIAMGWIFVIGIWPNWALLRDGISWLLIGGVAYTVGAIFYAFPRFRFAHAVWHVFVLAGSLCHFFGILWHVVLKSM